MATGWKMVDGAWYYLNANGAMATGWVTIDGGQFYFHSSGVLIG